MEKKDIDCKIEPTKEGEPEIICREKGKVKVTSRQSKPLVNVLNAEKWNELVNSFRIPNPKQLKLLREQAGLTRTDLAVMTGTSSRMISEYEKGTATPTTIMLNRILNAFLISPP